MDTLVSKYDKAVEDLIERDKKIQHLTDDLLQANRERESCLEENHKLKTSNDSQKKEIFDVYSSLRRKEEVLRNLEDRLNRKIGEKEEQCMTLQSKLNHLEQTFSRETTNIEQLRRLCDERTEVGANLEQTIREKDAQIRDMKAEVIQARITSEQAYR